MASVDRLANVIGKQLGPQWQILRWHRVSVADPQRGPYCYREFLFPDETLAVKFVAKVRKKYPERNIHDRSVYVLTANGGKTGIPLGIFVDPKRRLTVPDF